MVRRPEYGGKWQRDRDIIAPMKPVREFLGVLSGPFYALAMNLDHSPKPYHVLVWFLIFVASELVSLMSDLVEHDLSALKGRFKMPGTQN